MIYRYKATLSGVKSFIREFEFKPEMKLYKVHRFLAQQLGFSPDQMFLFESYNSKGQMSEYGLFDFGNGSMDSFSLIDIRKKDENLLHYIYNIDGKMYLILEFIEESMENHRMKYPRVALEKGLNPNQFSNHYDEIITHETPKKYDISEEDLEDDNSEEEIYVDDEDKED